MQKIGFLLLCMLCIGVRGFAMDVEAKAALLIDTDTNQILYQKNIDERLAPASITKLMTAYLIFDGLKENKIHLKDQIKVSPYAASMEESSFHLKAGEKVSVKELLTSIIVASANDSCVAMAEALAGSEKAFVEKMNQKARSLGMKNTHFMNTNGLPDGDKNPSTGHYMSARDILILSRALIKEYPEVLQYSKIREMNVPSRGFKKENTNKLLKQLPGVDGLKTGYTEEAGDCLVSTMDISKTNAKKGHFRMLAVVLGTASEDKRFAESKKLLLYGKEKYEKIHVASKELPLDKMKILRGKELYYEMYPQKDVYVLIPKGRKDQIAIKVELLPQKEMLGKKAGQAVGRIEVTTPVQKKMQVDLVTKKDIQSVNVFVWMVREIEEVLGIL